MLNKISTTDVILLNKTALHYIKLIYEFNIYKKLIFINILAKKIFSFVIPNMNINGINSIKYYNIYPRISFHGQVYNPKKNCADSFYKNDEFINEITTTQSKHIKSITFKKPFGVSEVLKRLSHTKNKFLADEFLLKLHPLEQLSDMAEVLSTDSIGKIKVSSIVGIGAFSVVFKTTDNKILKITDVEHFPNNRKPADFDLPIIKKGKLSKDNMQFYYYIEDEVTQSNITQKEIRQLVNHIKSLGYKMKDYLVHFDNNEVNGRFKIEQFGKDKNGRLYLIDPGCAIETSNVFKTDRKYSFKKFLNLLKK